MNKFFPWNLQLGAGGGAPIPDSGCPLEKHPNWFVEAGLSPSGLCWESSNGRSVSVASEDDVVRNISFRSNHFINGLVSAKIVTISTETNDWMLPLCGRMIDPNNLIGARWINGKFEVVQRVGGTWSTLFSGGPVPATDDIVRLKLIESGYELIVNGVTIQNDTHGLPGSEGFWGLSTHRAPSFIGQTLFSEFFVVNSESSFFSAFIFEATDTEKSIDLKISLPDSESGFINWGDGSREALVGPIDKVEYSHDYAVQGDYPIALSQNITYLLVSNVANITGNIAKLPKNLIEFDLSDDNTMAGDIANLPPNMTKFVLRGENIVNGDIANLPDGLTYLNCYGENTISGDIANIPAGVTFFSCYGNTSISGDIINLPSVCSTFSAGGNSSISGDIADLHDPMKAFRAFGRNTITGNLADLPATVDTLEIEGENTLSGTIESMPVIMDIFNVKGGNTLSGDIGLTPEILLWLECTGKNTVDAYTSKAWTAMGIQFIVLEPVLPGGLDSAAVDQMIIDLSGAIWIPFIGLLTLTGSNAPRTSASDAAVATLLGKRVHVTTNQSVTHNTETVTYNGEAVYSRFKEE